MAKFIMLGRYLSGSIEGISSERTEGAKDLISRLGGELENGYTMLGEYDLLLIVDFPDIEAAMKASVELCKVTQISFSTFPAVSVDRFDELMET